MITTYDLRKRISVKRWDINDFGLFLAYTIGSQHKALVLPPEQVDDYLLASLGEDLETTGSISQYDAIAIAVYHELALSVAGGLLRFDMARIPSNTNQN